MSCGVMLVHVGLMLAVLGWGLWRLRHDLAALVCALFVVAWTDLVATALLLSAFKQLGNCPAYIGVSLVLAVAMVLAIRRMPPAEALPHDSDADEGFGASRLARALLWLTILAVIVPTAMLCVGYDPDNFDSVAYRLPRAFFYIGQGTLRHLSGGDFRMQYYPFNMTLAYLGIAIHGLAGHWLNGFSALAWLVGGFAVHRTARDYGAGKTAALFATALYLTTPAVLISASSTNDDMIAGVPLLIGVLFATRWWHSGNGADAAFAAMGIGLSAGSKLHYPFLVPVTALFGLVLVYRLFAAGQLWVFLQRRFLQIAGALGVMAVLALPALIINFAETGRATPDLPNYINAPFSPVAAGTTSVVTSASLFLSPIPDLDLDPDTARRHAIYDAFNAWQNKHLFSWVSPALNYSNEPYYRFEGVASNDAYLGLWEQSAWMGFVPWLFLLVPAVAWSKGVSRDTPRIERLRTAAIWLVAAFFGWHFTRCFVMKYVGAAGIYYAYAAVLGAPAVAWLWDAARPDRRRLQLVLRTACAATLLTNLVHAANAFAYNQQRNLRELVRSEHFRPRQGIVGPTLSAALKASRHTLIAYTEWELPFLDLISVEPLAHYAFSTALGASPVPGYDLSLMLQRTRSEYGEVPIQFTNDDRQRLALFGSMSSVFGQQRAFGHGEIPKAKPRAADVVADYEAGTDDGDLNLASGWSTSEHTHRWSDGRMSTIAFDVPPGKDGCHLDTTTISFGPQRVSVTLNDQPAGSLSLDGWFPGQDNSLPLPDGAMIPGHVNRLTLSYDNAHGADGDSRIMAMGLIKAAVKCRSANAQLGPKAPSGTLTSLTVRGFAVLAFAERRNAADGLTGLTLNRISGTDPDEAFDLSLTLRSAKGDVVNVADLHPIDWSRVIEIPGAPTDGSLDINLQRRDRHDIAAHVALPVATGRVMALDLRSEVQAKP